jgi:hypothetical protein
MQQPLFLRIMQAVWDYDPYFLQKRNAKGILGLSNIQKCTVVLCILACGISPDATDEYYRLAKSIAMEAMKRYVREIRAVFGATYMRQPTCDDLVY